MFLVVELEIPLSPLVYDNCLNPVLIIKLLSDCSTFSITYLEILC